MLLGLLDRTGAVDGRGAAPSQRGEEEGGMDHLTDPLTVAAAATPSLSAREREIEVGDWGEGGIAEKLFWPLQWPLWSNGPTAVRRCTTRGSWHCRPLLVLPLAWRRRRTEYFLCRVIHTREEMPEA